ncbi:MAG: substrate-binding domain-containing protein [Dongiaceae bacterium]
MEPIKSPKAFASAKQVAERAGVSRSAVSRAFTPGASISEEKRRRILLASEELGYHVNHLARGLLQSSGIVCLIVADSDTPYQARLVRTLIEHLQNAGKVSMVLSVSRQLENIEHTLRQTLNYRADATVVLSGTPPHAIIRTCLDSGQRMILINRDDHLAGPYHIDLDSMSAARTALHALCRAGCQRLAVVSSEAGTASLVAREAAFRALADEQGLDTIVTRKGRTSYESGADGARALLAGSKRPDGVFCTTDLIACGFMDVARHEFRLLVPEQLCVIGFDDIEPASWGSYRLTTFAPPIDRLAARVVELVTVGGESSRDGGRTTLEADFVWRDTVRPGLKHR